MNQALRKDAQQILASSLQAVLPDEAVQRALRDFEPHGGRVLLVAAGKAAWQMAAQLRKQLPGDIFQHSHSPASAKADAVFPAGVAKPYLSGT